MKYTPTKKEIQHFYDERKDITGLPEERHYNTVREAGKLFGKVLDIGCGRGGLCEVALRSNKKIKTFGTDISFELLKEAKKVKGLLIFCGDAESLPIKSECFDVVFLTEVLEHLLEPEKALLEINRILKLNGKFIISVPNKWWIFPYLPNSSKKYTPSRQIVDRKYSHLEIRKIIIKSGFKIIKSRPSGPILGEKYDVYLYKIPGSIYMTKRIWLLTEKVRGLK